ncbi:MAG: gluconokinase [Chitinophagaceae bacterium]
MNYFLGVDIGTTHTKAVVTTIAGTTFFEAKRSYGIIRPQPGHEEQDADEILDAVTAVIKEAIAQIPSSDKVAAVGFSAAMHSLLPVDQAGKPLHHAIIWADTRSKNEAEEISRDKCAAVIINHTGIPLHPMSPLCKILWFKNNLPDTFSKAHKFISIKEYVFFHFFGKYITDHSIASATGYFNIREKKWDKTALNVIGLCEERLSQPVATVHAEKELTPSYAELLGIKENIPFIIGASDGCLANLGSGAVNHGETALTVGTSGAVRMTVQRPPSQNDGHLFTYPLADNLFVRGGAINNGGVILKWLIDLFLSTEKKSAENYAQLIEIAQQVPPGANGLIFLPYLLGERAPIWDADAKGVLFGLTMQHRKEHIVRAALEGICFTLYNIIKELEKEYGEVKEIYVNGGFVQSPFWIQMLADISGKKLCVTDVADASSIGAAYLAMYATGYVKDLSEVKQFTHITTTYEADESLTTIYQEKFKLFVSLYPKLKDSFTALSS